MNEQDALNEEIMHSLRKLNSMSRRGPGPRPGDPELPPHPGEPDRPDRGRGPDPQRKDGRGRLMGMLHDHGAMSQSRLAELLDVRPQSLSELLVKMEGDGLVSRVQSEEDRRQIIVSLTDEGSARVDSFRSMQRRFAAEFLSPLNEEEKKTLAALLRKLTGPECPAPSAGCGQPGETHD